MGTRLVSSVSLVKLLMPFAIFSMHVLSKACIHSLHKNCAEGFALIPTVHIERAIGYNVLFFNRYRKEKISKQYFNDSHSHYISTAESLAYNQ